MTVTRFFHPKSLNNHPTVLHDNELEHEADLLCSEMLRELLLHRAEKKVQKMSALRAGKALQLWPAPRLPTSSYATAMIHPELQY